MAALDRGARDQMEAILRKIEPDARPRLVAAVREVRSVLGAAGIATTAAFDFASPRPAISASSRTARCSCTPGNTAGTGPSRGWSAKFSPNSSPISTTGRKTPGSPSEAGAIVGSVFLMKSDDPATGKLRLLYVEPSARGLEIGRELVDACLRRARELGYAKVTLWTNDILVSARRIYQAAGFHRSSEESPHHSFGYDLIGQTWTLDLREHPMPE